MKDLTSQTPKDIVAKLDQYVIGQERAKRIVAIALRNRLRRMRLSEDIRDEVAPKNIIMIGPTGVGKTEIARRIAKLIDAPFVKVEATKYTEVGYVGRDVESMIRDLMANSMALVKVEQKVHFEKEAQLLADDRIIQSLLPGTESPEQNTASQQLRSLLDDGKLEDKEIEISQTKNNVPTVEISNAPNIDDFAFNFGGIGNIFGKKTIKRKMKIKDARQMLIDEECEKLIDDEKVAEIAKKRVEESGIVFIDEIDKIASDNGTKGVNVSREGVQRDILPIIEGCAVKTRYGQIDTTHILFIAAGAFHAIKPSDLIPELQGRFPLRVELNNLNHQDFVSILTTPRNALVKQYIKLLETEGVLLDFTSEAIEQIATMAIQINTDSDNIGARRLYTIMELLLEDISYNAPELQGQTIPVTAEFVKQQLEGYIDDQDLSKYIL